MRITQVVKILIEVPDDTEDEIDAGHKWLKDNLTNAISWSQGEVVVDGELI